jgi:hypothetical protein
MGEAITGRCLCGGVRFETDGRGIMGYCHCSICRKWSGAIFTTNLNAERDGFRFLEGEDRIERYNAVDGSGRGHCRTCGSVVPGGPLDAPWVAIGAGLLDADPGLRPAGHVWIESKVPWLELDDELPRFERWVPRLAPEWAQADSPVEPGPRTDWTRRSEGEAPVRGSCLCGTVRYEVDPVPLRFLRCHCGRCRRTTGSAYACNLYVEPSHFRWTAGTHAIVRFDLPEARSFSNEFCRRCGSSLPHATRSRGEWVVLTGTLDDDPGCRLEGDIFLEDRAAWV